MALINPTLPTVGQDRGTEEADVLSVLTALLAEFNGNVDNANIKSTAGILASKLETNARPTTLLGQYRTVAEGHGYYADIHSTSGVYIFSGSDGLLPSTQVGEFVDRTMLPLDPADYAVAGLTAKFRLRAIVCSNGTAPALTFTFGLYPVSAVSGAADQFSVTTGTVTPGSTVAIASPGANARVSAVGADFTPPAADIYALAVNLSAGITANSAGYLYIRLDVRHV